MQSKLNSAARTDRDPIFSSSTRGLARISGAVACFALVFSAFACGGETNEAVDTSLDTPTTRIRTVDKMQAVFDLMPKSAHDDMMEMMGGADSVKTAGDEHAHHGGHDHAGDSHFVLLTLMDTANRGAAVTDAEVSFRVLGPGNQELAQGGHVMSGKGMHHYAVGFVGKDSGQYTVEAQIKRGGVSYDQSVQFDIGGE
ncbi:MAG: hypothetical protein NXI24_01960 [bacterium]|nr:hypothetical protein [bacterium]